MSDEQQSQASANTPPTAVVRPANTAIRLLQEPPSRLWALAALCLLFTILLVFLASRGRGTNITVHFQQGHGIKPGDLLRHRGIEVGEVVAVKLSGDLGGVDVSLELEPAATTLAREGSQFWIERPRFSLARVSGLETVMGAKYLGVLPGPQDAAPRFVFEGDETPLTMLDSNVVEIEIRFRRGYGLAVGGPLKHRGIVVGEVTAVDLKDDLSGVTVRVRLVETAQRLARAGSQFWVERPDVSLTGVRGLETLVGGHYLAVEPGPVDAPPLAVFDGFEDVPSISEQAAGGLEIVLGSPRRRGVEAGAPVSFRGLQVGHVIAVSLSPDATKVEARAYIKPGYKQLVRDNSKFWSTSGIDFNIGLTGVKLNADTLKTIAAGGVAFATPDEPGRLVKSGHAFTLSKAADSKWLAYSPRLAVGATLLPDGSALPHPLRVTLHWQEKRLGITRNREQDVLALLLDNGDLVAPRDLLSASKNALADSVRLEFEGGEHRIVPDTVENHGGLAFFPVGTGAADQSKIWPAHKIRLATGPEDGLIVSGTQDSHLPLPAERISTAEQSWQIDPSFTVNPKWHGASVVAIQDGSLLGLVLLEKGQARVERIGK